MIPIWELDPYATGKVQAAIRDLGYRLENILTDWRIGTPIFSASYLTTSIGLCLLLGDNDIKAVEDTLAFKAVDIERWFGKDFYEGCPSDTTLLRTLWNANPTELLTAVVEWNMQWFGVDKNYSIDGKAVRAALEKVCGKTHSPYILNAFADNGRWLAAQIKINAKRNELSTVEELLKLLPMVGAFITADAFATYPKVIEIVLDMGGHCLLPIKDNEKILNKQAKEFFARMETEKPNLITWYEDKDNGQPQHGRVETRITGVITEGVDELVKGTAFEGLVTGLARVSRDRSIIRREGENIDSNQTLLYLFTKPNMTAEEVANAARGHWRGCEMVHYVLDTEFQEDISTIRKGHGMENMSCLRKWAYGLLTWIKTELYLQSNATFDSYGQVRRMLRDLNGIPELSEAEYRKLVNEFIDQSRHRKKWKEGNNFC